MNFDQVLAFSEGTRKYTVLKSKHEQIKYLVYDFLII